MFMVRKCKFSFFFYRDSRFTLLPLFLSILLAPGNTRKVLIRTEPISSFFCGPGNWTSTEVTAATPSTVGSIVMARTLYLVSGSGRRVFVGESLSRIALCWWDEQTAWNLLFVLFLDVGEWWKCLRNGSLSWSMMTNWEANGRWAIMVISTACLCLALLMSVTSFIFQKTTQAARKRKKQEKKTNKSIWSWSCLKKMFPRVGSDFWILAPCKTR